MLSNANTQKQEPKWEIVVHAFKPVAGADLHIKVQELGLYDHERPALKVAKMLLNWLHFGQWPTEFFGAIKANAPKDYIDAEHEVFALRSLIEDWGANPAKVLVTICEYGAGPDSKGLDVDEYATAKILEAA